MVAPVNDTFESKEISKNHAAGINLIGLVGPVNRALVMIAWTTIAQPFFFENAIAKQIELVQIQSYKTNMFAW